MSNESNEKNEVNEVQNNVVYNIMLEETARFALAIIKYCDYFENRFKEFPEKTDNILKTNYLNEIFCLLTNVSC